MNSRILFAVPALLLPLAAQAKVTPEEVWANWQALSAAGGATIAAENETREGDTLVIRGVTTTAPQPDASAAAAMGRIDEIRLRDLGDGTVEITHSETFSVTVQAPAAPGIEPPLAQEMTLAVSAPGAVTLASGSPEAMRYQSTLPALEVTLAAPEGAEGALSLNLTLANAMTDYLSEGADRKTVSGSMAAESLAFAMAGTDAETGESFDMTRSMGELAATFDATLLPAEAMQDMAAAIAAGFAFHFDLTQSAGSFSMNGTQEGMPMSLTGRSEGGGLRVGLDQSKFEYAASAKGVAVSVSSPAMPMPEAEVTLAELGISLAMPVTPAEAPGDFGLTVTLTDLALPKEAWEMFDPMAMLPHDPASLAIEISGTARLTRNLFDPHLAADMAAAPVPPGELLSLDLPRLLARVAGAELTGSGALTFDNAVPGMPMPTGTVDLRLTGANRLIDALLAMGMMTEDDAMSARMMIAMFANPGPGEDELTSAVEFRDGGVFVNGQQFQ